jgi:hypothetical protein
VTKISGIITKTGKNMQKIFLSFILIILIIFACSIDHGVEPLPGTLRVKVTFIGKAPANTQGIYLVVAPEFPPHAINELFHSPNSLPIDKEVVHTEMALPYGHYDAFMLWWYNKETKSNLADVFGPELDLSSGLIPLDFEITPQNPITSEIPMTANWARVDRDAAIEGTIYFNGPYPKNTLATAIAAYSIKPTTSVEYLVFLQSMDFSVEGNPYHFNLPLRKGSVEYIVVFWLPERASLADFETLGTYKNPKNPTEDGKLLIKAGEIRKGIDIYADWSLINNGQGE